LAELFTLMCWLPSAVNVHHRRAYKLEQLIRRTDSQQVGTAFFFIGDNPRSGLGNAWALHFNVHPDVLVSFGGTAPPSVSIQAGSTHQENRQRSAQPFSLLGTIHAVD
jgi:hypothetical protein